MSGRPRYHPPLAVCSRCGRERPCFYATTDKPLCDSCRSNRDRQRDWRAPIAVCSRCGRERGCYHARTDAPVCLSCSAARFRVCATCGRNARVAGRTVHGPECVQCRQRRLRAKIDCQVCGLAGHPSGADGTVCQRCAGERITQGCRRCGAEEQNYTAGLCPRCSVAERLETVVRTGDSGAVARLQPYLEALRNGPEPRSVLNWMGVSAGYQTVLDLAAGRVEISHEGLDRVERGQTTRYLRGALIRAGVLDPRPEHSANLDALIRVQLAVLPEGEDRSHLRAFAVWQAGHDLHQRERRGLTTRASHKLTRSQITLAAQLIAWLHSNGGTLRDLDQHQLDQWLAEGSSMRPRVRSFVKWAHRGGLLPALQMPQAQTRSHVRPLDAEQRLQIVGALLSDEATDLRDRVAGCLVLIFAQPISRIAKLTAEDIHDDVEPVRISLGREPLELPEPLGALTVRLKHERPGLATTATGTSPSQWLFPGLRLDASIHPEHLRHRLKRYGITARSARAAALTDLAQVLPAAILADLLGISESQAARWTQAANGDWARYAAQRHLTAAADY